MHNSKFIYTFALKIINLIMAGIYLHIPFCKKRCIYCDFFSTTQSEKKDNYVQALCNELKLRKDYLGTEYIETIYLGGGTPSQLAPKDFVQIFQSRRQHQTQRHIAIPLSFKDRSIYPRSAVDSKFLLA